MGLFRQFLDGVLGSSAKGGLLGSSSRTGLVPLIGLERGAPYQVEARASSLPPRITRYPVETGIGVGSRTPAGAPRASRASRRPLASRDPRPALRRPAGGRRRPPSCPWERRRRPWRPSRSSFAALWRSSCLCPCLLLFRLAKVQRASRRSLAWTLLYPPSDCPRRLIHRNS